LHTYTTAFYVLDISLASGKYPKLSQSSNLAYLQKMYRPISLLPVLSNVFEKLFITRVQPILQSIQIIPDHQFGFRRKHSTIEPVHHITSKIHRAIENKQYCTAAFLDISQAFDKVWHEGLLHKLNTFLPDNMY